MAFFASTSATATSSASVASMVARLASKLSLSHQDEPVDLGNLKCSDRGFIALRFYLVGKLNTARAVAFDAFKSDVRSMWRLTTPVEVQARGDRFLFTFTNRVKRGGPWSFQQAMILLNDYDGFSDIMAVLMDFVWIWVEIINLPVALMTSAAAQLVGETIGLVLRVDAPGLARGKARVRLTLPLNDPVFLQRRLRVSPKDIITVEYKYERLCGRYGNCMMINHGGLRCPRVVEVNSYLETEEPCPTPIAPPMVFKANAQHAPLPPPLAAPKEKRQVLVREHGVIDSPPKVSGGRRHRADSDGSSGKRCRHGLNLGLSDLTPSKLGLRLSSPGVLGIKKTVKSPAKDDRPRGSRMKNPKAQRSLNAEAEHELQLTVAEMVAQSKHGPELAGLDDRMCSSSGQDDGGLGLGNEALPFAMLLMTEGEELEKAAKEVKVILKILEEQGLGEEFFGGYEIGMADLAMGFIASTFGVIEEMAGIKVLNGDEFPGLFNWVKKFKDNPAIKKNLPDPDQMFEYYKQKREMLVAPRVA